MAAEVMYQAVRCLLIFREIPALVESSRSGRVHEEVRRSGEFNNESTWSLRSALGIARRVAILQCDILDVRKWVLDLVPC